MIINNLKNKVTKLKVTKLKAAELIIIAILLVIFSVPAFAKPLVADTVIIKSNAKIGSLDLIRWTTDNGMQVLFAKSRQLPIVDLRLVFDAGGARDMDPTNPEMQLPGLAKLTNGLIYEGSKGFSAQQIAETFEGMGVQYGNGSYRDMAVLDFRSLSDKKILFKALDSINKILAQPLFEQNVLNRERNKMLVALKLAEENPSRKAGLSFYKTLYSNKQSAKKQNHPYASPTNGTKESLNKINRDALKNYYKKFYVASNAVLAVVGDLSLNDVQKLAERLSKTLGKGVHAVDLPTVDTSIKGQTIKIKHPSTQTTIVMGMPVLSRGDKDYYALYLGNHILGGSGFSSRLVKEVRVKQGLTYSVSSYFAQMRAKGPFQISLTTKNESANKAIELVNQVVSDFIKSGPTAEELKQAKLNISGSFPLRTKSNKNIVEHLAVIGFYNLPENYLDIFKDKIEKITLADINDTFKRRVDLSKLSTIVVGDFVQ
ncbi:MAG: pitrilysin family protein [Pseudomonadota bacterium]